MFDILQDDPKIFEELRKAARVSTSIPDKLRSLAENPYSVAIPTNKPVFGNYYMKAGRYCILFDIDESINVIRIYEVLLHQYWYKILTGRLTPQKSEEE